MLVAAVENIVPGSFLSALSLKGIHPGCLSFYCRCPISLVVKKHRCHTETMATTSERAKKKKHETTSTNLSLCKQLPEQSSNLPLLWSIIIQDTHPDTKRLRADIVFSPEMWWGRGAVPVREDGMDCKDHRSRVEVISSWISLIYHIDNSQFPVGTAQRPSGTLLTSEIRFGLQSELLTNLHRSCGQMVLK